MFCKYIDSLDIKQSKTTLKNIKNRLNTLLYIINNNKLTLQIL